LQNIIWSPNQEKVISVFNQEGKTSFSSYDYNERKGKRLADGIANATWNNLGDKIIYQYHDAGKKTGSLSIADPDGKNWQNLAATGLGKVSLAPVPQTTYLSFWNYPNAYEETALETVNFTGGEVKKIFSGKYGADYLWSPNGKKILVSSSDAKGGSKMMLATANENGGEYQNLNIPTMVSKCVWSSGGNKVYYALPGAIDPGTILPNDYQSKKITTQDTFWEVDVTNGKQERLIELNEMGGSSRTFDAGDLFLSPDEDILFFINRTDGKLYRIDI
jgi:Tol biopolymer transport system component